MFRNPILSTRNDHIRSARVRLTASFRIVSLFFGAVFLATITMAPAKAASLVEVTNFGTNPTGLRMFLYVPNTVAARPAIVVALHFCGGSGPVFFSATDFASLADKFGFILIFPSVTRSFDCFDVSTAGTLTHNGNSDPVGITSMVHFVEQTHNGDPNRVFVTGASSGAMMTNVLLGDYPDVFKAGAAFMGVPFSCFATTNGSLWNSNCANGTIIKTPQQWGDLVRGAFPGFSGARPRMQLWHGTADTTLHFPNFGEEIKQWTNVLGVSQTPSLTDNPQPTWTHTRYGGTGINVPVEAFAIQNVGHVLPIKGTTMAALAIQFFGLGSATAAIATPVTAATSVSCRVTTSTTSASSAAMTGVISIINTGNAPINDWSLIFTLPNGQKITSSWGAEFSLNSGEVVARDSQGQIAPGSSIGIGFEATHPGNTAEPTGFALNGVPCTTN